MHGYQIFFVTLQAIDDTNLINTKDMAQNKGAIVRYRAIDKCLRKRGGKYGIEELIHACEEALYDAFSKRITVGRRQIFNDLNHMESNAGYCADIE